MSATVPLNANNWTRVHVCLNGTPAKLRSEFPAWVKCQIVKRPGGVADGFLNAYNGSLSGGTYIVRNQGPQNTRRIVQAPWNSGRPGSGKIVEFASANGHAEDPRAFVFNNQICCIFTDGYEMYLGYLQTEQCCKLQVPVHKGADYDGREKNWSPFVYGNCLHVLYKPGHVLKLSPTGEILGEYFSDPPTLNSGEYIRGGTQIVLYRGKYYTFYHVNCRGHYWAGCLELEAIPPFRALRWTRKPLFKGPAPRNIIFPCHLEIDSEGGVLMLGGINDASDCIMTFNMRHVEPFLE